MNDYHKKRTSQIPEVGVPEEQPMSSLNYFLKFTHSVCTTVAEVTKRWVMRFVDEVGSTVFYKNFSSVFATSATITKADLPVNFTSFYCRMNTMQPAWPVCSASVCWHTRCWHFCSCCSHKTIPSLRELVVTQLWTVRCYVT